MVERIPDLILIAVLALTLVLLPYLQREERSHREERRPTEELHIRPPRVK